MYGSVPQQLIAVGVTAVLPDTSITVRRRLCHRPKKASRTVLFRFSCFEINDRIVEAKIVELYDLCGNVE